MEPLKNVENKQRKIARIAWISAIVFFVLLFCPIIAENGQYWQYPVLLLSIFLCISCIIIALIFRSRAKKLDKLNQGITLLTQWELSEDMVKSYAEEGRKSARNKNKIIISVIGFFFVVLTIGFLIFIKEDHLLFFIIMGASFLLPFTAALLMPLYYYHKNLKGDRKVMIGGKFAYFNGYFHNWDYPLSGLSKVKIIKKPFYGLFLSYYYTDRTFTHSAEFLIPAPDHMDLNSLIDQLKAANKK